MDTVNQKWRYVMATKRKDGTMMANGKYVRKTEQRTKNTWSIDNRMDDMMSVPIAPPTYVQLDQWSTRHGFVTTNDKTYVRNYARNGDLPNSVVVYGGTWVIRHDEPVPDCVALRGRHVTRDDGRNKFILYANTTDGEYERVMAALRDIEFDVTNLVINPRD